MITLGNNISHMERTGRGRTAKDVPQGNHFGAWLRARRTDRHLTGEALAFAIGGGMTQGRISAYERGHKKPERDTAVRIAEALNTEPREALEALMADTEGYSPTATPEESEFVRAMLNATPEQKAVVRALLESWGLGIGVEDL